MAKAKTTTKPKFEVGEVYITRNGKLVRLLHIFSNRVSSQTNHYWINISSAGTFKTYPDGSYYGPGQRDYELDVLDPADIQFMNVDKDPKSGKLSLFIFDTEKEAKAARNETTVNACIPTVMETFLKKNTIIS